MATAPKVTGTAQKRDANVDVAPGLIEALNAAMKALPRSVVIATVGLNFVEASTEAATSARWDDVLNAAKEFAPSVEESAKNPANKTPSAIARAAASKRQGQAFALRIALASHSQSGHKANANQLAALGSILPALQTKGSLRDRSVNFGGIALPPLAGDIS